jgi:hypothetical protein
MHTINTTNGFTVTITSGWVRPNRFDTRFDSAWTCTCGRNLNAAGRSSVADNAEAHAAMHNAESNTLVVTEGRHESFFMQLVEALGDAVVEWTFTPGTFTIRGRTLVRNELVVVIDPSVTTPADAHATVRGRGFNAHFRNRSIV